MSGIKLVNVAMCSNERIYKAKTANKRRTALLILAAGQGSRMNSKLPKALQPVAGEPSICRIIKQFGDIVSDVHIVASPKFKHRLEKAIERENFPQNVHYIVQENPTGILDAVHLGAQQTGNVPTWLIWCDQPCYDKSFLEDILTDCKNREFDVAVPIFEKTDGYIHYNIDGKSVEQIYETREGDFVPRPSISDGGLFYFKNNFLCDLAKVTDLVRAGDKTGEKNFIKIFESSVFPPHRSIRFIYKGTDDRCQGFNTPKELDLVSSIVRSRI